MTESFWLNNPDFPCLTHDLPIARKTCKIIVSEKTHSVPALLQLATTCCPARRTPTPSSPPQTVSYSHFACRTCATPPRFDHIMEPSIIRCPALHRISRLCRFFTRNSPKKFPSLGNRTSSSSFSLGIPDSMLLRVDPATFGSISGPFLCSVA